MGFLFSRLKQGEVPVLFLPGWGFDYQLIKLYGLFAGKNLLLPDSFLAPVSFHKDLLHTLDEHSCEKINIVGWSMGAQLAFDFCLMHPDRVSSLHLVAMRGTWPKSEIEEIRQGVDVDMVKYMIGFYRKCFLGYKKAYKEFVSSLQDDYLMKLDRDILVQGLDYLQHFNLSDQLSVTVPVRLLHGRKDIVAPVKEMVHISSAEEKVLEHSGHMVLLDTILSG